MDEADILFENILSTQEIQCSRCMCTGTEHNIGDYEAAESFQRKGWRATRQNIYCPTCSEKKLKPKKKNGKS